jgi:hypothetical protein
MPRVGGTPMISTASWVPQVCASSSSAKLPGTIPRPKCSVSLSQYCALSAGLNVRSGSTTNGWEPNRGT